jgi:hypothetical protein
MSAQRLSNLNVLVPQSSSTGRSSSPTTDDNAQEGIKVGMDKAATEAGDSNLKEEVKDSEKEKKFSTFDELPMFKNMPGCAWSLWGENDQLGTVNMVTEEVVARAAMEEIKYDINLNSVF